MSVTATSSNPALIPNSAAATATISGGIVTGIGVTSGGTGYAFPPVVTISGGGGTGATATAVLGTGASAGVITSINFTGGSGYTSAPTITIAPPTATAVAAATLGSGATAGMVTSISTSGAITSITVTNQGLGYSSANLPNVTIAPPASGGVQATATAIVTGGVITGITINNAGSGYSSASPPAITIDPPLVTGTRATATATFTSGGVGYLSPPMVTLSPPPSGGTQATASAVVVNGVVTGFTITSAGSGYTSAPVVTVNPPIATATAAAVLNGSAVGSISVANGGAGYLNPPVVTLTGGGGTGATATAVVNNGVVTSILFPGGSGYTSAPTVSIASPGRTGGLTVNYTSPNTTGTLSYSLAPDAFGTATITVTVTDSGGTANGGVNTFSQAFVVNVGATNQAPTLNPITVTPTVLEGTTTAQTVNLTGIGVGPGNTGQTLAVTATSSNTALIPNPTVTYTANNPTGLLSFTPVGFASGTAVITVTVTESGGTATGGTTSTSQSFTVNVTAIDQAFHAQPDPEPRRNRRECGPAIGYHQWHRGWTRRYGTNPERLRHQQQHGADRQRRGQLLAQQSDRYAALYSGGGGQRHGLDHRARPGQRQHRQRRREQYHPVLHGDRQSGQPGADTGSDRQPGQPHRGHGDDQRYHVELDHGHERWLRLRGRTDGHDHGRR